jgi:hypothetical protein
MPGVNSQFLFTKREMLRIASWSIAGPMFRIANP